MVSVVSQIGTAQAANPPKRGFKVAMNEHRQKGPINYGDVPVDFKLLGADTADRLSVFISTNNRKGHGGTPPLHVHYTFDEFFCILSGSFVFLIDGERIPANTGDCVYIPRGAKHTFACTSEQPSSLLVGITPSKGMENYFIEMANALTPQGPNMAAMNAAYKKYNSEILGPPIEG